MTTPTDDSLLTVILPRVERLERGHDACHNAIREIKVEMATLQTDHSEHMEEMLTIEKGYQLILREVRETRSAVELLFSNLAQEKLEASKRHADLLKQAGRGIFWLSALVAILGAIHGIITGQPLPESLMSIWQSIIG